MMTQNEIEYNTMLVNGASDSRRCFSADIPQIVAECEVHCVDDSEEAIAEIKSGQIDCVVIDLADGFEAGVALCERIKGTRNEANLTVLLIADSALETAQRLAGHQAGADGFILRPLQCDEIEAKLRVFIRVKQAEEALRRNNARLARLAEHRIHALREADARFKFLFETSRDAVLYWHLHSDGSDLKIVDVNERACRLLHYAYEELLNISIFDILPEDRRTVLAIRIESILKHKQLYFETILKDKLEQPVPVGVHAQAFEGDGEIVKVLTVMRDLRAKHSTIQDAVEGENKFRTLVDHTGQMIYDLNLQTRQIQVGGAVTQVSGFLSRDIRDFTWQAWIRLLHPDDRRHVHALINHALETVGKYQLRYRMRHKSGEFRHVEDIGVVLPDAEGSAYRLLGTIKDVTAMMLAEREEKRLEQSKHNSQRLESLGVLAGGIAHDFNNILAAIIGLTDMAVQDLPEESLTRGDLEEVLQAAHRAKDLVKQILAFSRQSGEERSPVFLHVVVREALQLLKASLPANIEIMDNIDVHTGAINANATQIHQVVMNYCTNAAHALQRHGGRLIITLRDITVDERLARQVPHLRAGPYIKLSIEDTGHGIKPALIERIFDPFFSTKGPGEGTGMGLAVVHGIVSAHGGAVDVESELGRGTVFHTYFPRIEAGAENQQENTEVATVGKERILLVDDEESVLRFGEAALGRLGYTVKSFSQPDDALLYFQENHKDVDLLITDQMMPRILGSDLLREFKEIKPELPSILFTGFSQQNLDEDFEGIAVDMVVMKPIIAKDLAAAVRQVLDQQPT